MLSTLCLSSSHIPDPKPLPGPGSRTFWGADSCTRSIDSSDLILLAFSDLLIPRALYSALPSDDPNKKTRSEPGLNRPALLSDSEAYRPLLTERCETTPPCSLLASHGRRPRAGSGWSSPTSAAAPSLSGLSAAAICPPGLCIILPLDTPPISHHISRTVEPVTA